MGLSATIKSFVREHENDDIRALALQARRYPDVDMQLVIQQIAGRQIAKEKIPEWYKYEDVIYPKHISLEQSSSQATAVYKARLCKGDSMVDLTGGLGIDFSFISQQFDQAVYVEQQSYLVELASHNFSVLNLKNTKVINEDATEYLRKMQKVNLIYIDPARRDSVGRKTVCIEDCTPNLIEIEDLLDKKAGQVMIKLSPMLDISLALRTLRNVSDVHIISVNNECKELLFIKDNQQTNRTTSLHCVNIQNNSTDKFSFTKEEEEQTVINYISTSSLNRYLYEPNASIIKAGAYKSTAKAFGIIKLHASSHLYTSENLLEDFPGRKFEIQSIFSLNKKEIKKHLHNIKQANITTRNFPLPIQEIRKKTGLKDGGDVYIFATTLADEKKVLILCKKI